MLRILSTVAMHDALATMETALAVSTPAGQAPAAPAQRATRLLPLAAAAAVAFFAGVFPRQAATPPVARGVSSAGPAPKLDARVTGMMASSGRRGHPLHESGSVKRPARRVQVAPVELTMPAAGGHLEGPGRFHEADSTSGRISAGKLVAYVPRAPKGTTVD
jgi:hypothetical protein